MRVRNFIPLTLFLLLSAPLGALFLGRPQEETAVRDQHAELTRRGVVSALVIIVTVPFGLAAAVLAIELTGGTMNVYSQIGLVLLVGVMAKNGILIVEFANIRRDEGADVA